MMALIPESWLARAKTSPMRTMTLGAPPVMSSKMPQIPLSLALKTEMSIWEEGGP